MGWTIFLLFQKIPFETPEKSDIPIGIEEKNRFANVLPCKYYSRDLPHV